MASESRDNWGPHLWKSIHYIAMFYPESPTNAQMTQYKKFFLDLQYVIPCHQCAENYKVHLQQLPIDNYLMSRDLLFAWTVELHNIVNRALKKREMPLEEARQLYFEGKPEKKPTSFRELLIVLAGTLFVIPLSLLLMSRKKRHNS